MKYSREMGMLREFGRVNLGLREVLPQLDDQERYLIENTIIVHKRGKLQEICTELGVEKSEVYRRRQKALARFSVLWRAWEAGR